MHCGSVFTNELLFSYFPRSWMSEYKKYQRNFAIEREKSLLIATMDKANFKKTLLGLVEEEKKISKDKYTINSSDYFNADQFFTVNKVTTQAILDIIIFDKNKINESIIILLAKLISKYNGEKSALIKTISDAKNIIDNAPKGNYECVIFHKNAINEIYYNNIITLINFAIASKYTTNSTHISFWDWPKMMYKIINTVYTYTEHLCHYCNEFLFELNYTPKSKKELCRVLKKCIFCNVEYCNYCMLFYHGGRDCDHYNSYTNIKILEIKNEYKKLDERHDFIKLRIENMKTGVDDFGDNTGSVVLHQTQPLYKYRVFKFLPKNLLFFCISC
jgi:hypothetical protein